MDPKSVSGIFGDPKRILDFWGSHNDSGIFGDPKSVSAIFGDPKRILGFLGIPKVTLGLVWDPKSDSGIFG